MTLMDMAQLLGSLGDFVGAIVVAVTLIYLSVQLRQNTRALHAQTRQAVLSGDQAGLLAILEHPDTMVATQGMRALSPEEHVKLGFWLTAMLRSRFFAWLQYRDGNIDELQWSLEVVIITRILGGEVPRLWWETVGRNAFPAEFVAFVDGHLRDLATGSRKASPLFTWANVQQSAASG